MRALRLAAAAFLFGGLVPLAGPISAACAAEGPSAVLVVDTEQTGGSHRFCVSLPDGSVSGIELVELANQQHGLQYRLGYGGNVVCQLAGVGYESDECLREGPEFWGYWRGDGSGGWDWSSSGGHATRVENGDVEGWSWGTGNDGSSHPAPSSTTFASVCGRPADPSGGSDGGGGKDGGGSGAGTGGDPSKGASGKDNDASAAVPDIADRVEAARKAGDAAGKDSPKKRAPNRKDGTDEDAKPDPARSNDPVPEPTPTAAAAEPTSFTDDDPTGVPVGGVLAAVAAALCVGGAVFLQRRRSRSG
jgi:hypothetical protein